MISESTALLGENCVAGMRVVRTHDLLVLVKRPTPHTLHQPTSSSTAGRVAQNTHFGLDVLQERIVGDKKKLQDPYVFKSSRPALSHSDIIEAKSISASEKILLRRK